jgi:hypothetical protein
MDDRTGIAGEPKGLTAMYNTKTGWVPGLYPSSGILNNYVDSVTFLKLFPSSDLKT